MEFNEKLANLRKQRGLSQEQLADKINVSRQAVSKWETAESQPDLAKLILLSNLLAVSLDELCGRTPVVEAATEMTPKPKPNKMNLYLVAALIFSLMIGVIGGYFSARILSPRVSAQKIDNISITNFSFGSGESTQIKRVVFCPSITTSSGGNNETFSYQVMKIDSDGRTTRFPATYLDGVCTCDISANQLFGQFTLVAVISDGTYDYSIGLFKFTDVDETGFAGEELWRNEST